jgi:chloramphenicol-sensitive protein RarD
LHAGVISAALAFIWWGLFPLYFRIGPVVPAAEVLAHRVVWCLLFMLGVMASRRQWAWLIPLIRAPKVIGAFAASAVLICANWATYIWSVQHGHVVDASLGYFINPLFNVLIGTTLLHERLRRAQWVALAVAGGGVVWLTLQAGQPPWIALFLAATFGAYGLLRKVAALGALEGLTLETLLLAPVAVAALVYWRYEGSGSFPTSSVANNLWLVGLGPMTAAPLLMFAVGARRLTMTTLGLLQYLGPTIQFLLAVTVFHEPLAGGRLAGYCCIWLALVIYSVDGAHQARRPAAAATATA